MVRILHSADWHLGHTLMGWSREAEHGRALAALVEIAVSRAVDAVIVAGDVFDGQNPSARAEQLLYRTLIDLRRRLPDAVLIVTAGNHDPAGRLEAPHALLVELGVHVIGTVARVGEAIDLDRHLIAVPARDGGANIHVLALPHLGPAALPPLDRRSDEPGSPVVRAVRAFHADAIAAARARIGAAPLVVTGHLAIAGASESEGAERRILIGGEHAIPTDLFPADLAYVALGHLHRAQTLANGRIRYAGSLFPLSATERPYDHGVTVATIADGATELEHVSIPRSARFLRVPATGALPLAEIEAALVDLGLDPDAPLDLRPFVQLAVRLDGPTPSLKADLDRLAAAHPIRFFGHTVERAGAAVETPVPEAPLLDLAEHDPADIFARAFTEAHGYAPEPAHTHVFDLVRAEE